MTEAGFRQTFSSQAAQLPTMTDAAAPTYWATDSAMRNDRPTMAVMPRSSIRSARSLPRAKSITRNSLSPTVKKYIKQAFLLVKLLKGREQVIRSILVLSQDTFRMMEI